MTANVQLDFQMGATWRWEFVSGTLVMDGDVPAQPLTIDQPDDFTGCTARMQVRKTYPLDDGSIPVLMEATTEDGGITLGTTDGTVAIVFTDTKTDLLQDDTGKAIVKGKYDLEVVYPSGDVVRLVEGIWTNDPNVTRDLP
jgi:hypothetical protein